MSYRTMMIVAAVIVMLALAWADQWALVDAIGIGVAVLWGISIGEETQRNRLRLDALEKDVAGLRRR